MQCMIYMLSDVLLNNSYIANGKPQGDKKIQKKLQTFSAQNHLNECFYRDFSKLQTIAEIFPEKKLKETKGVRHLPN